MNAYDFDNTIYDGESIVDFFFFCLKRDLRLLKYFPHIIILLMKYKLNLSSIEDISKLVEKFSNSFFKRKRGQHKQLVEQFWNKNSKKLKSDFLSNLKEDDLIITGSPNFLIDYIKDKLKVKNIICTTFDLETGKLDFLCFGKNKVKAFNKFFKNKRISKFYTDSLADIPFMKISDEVYLVSKNKIKRIDKSKYCDLSSQ